MSIRTHRNELFRECLKSRRIADFTVVDGHGHFGLYVNERTGKIYPDISIGEIQLQEEVTEIVSEMDNCGVSLGVVFHCGLEDYSKLNDITAKGVSFYPDRFIAYAFINMTKDTDNALREMERCRKLGMRGLKLHSSFDVEPFTSAKFIPVWKLCAEYKWPVIIHGMNFQLAYDYPETTFIGAHQIESINNGECVRAVQDCPHYYWDTSSTFCQMGAIAKAVDLLGADKLIFGSDYNLNNMAVRLGSVLTAKISEDDMKKILGGNIIRLLGIEIKNKFSI